jgi:hypothetical protein
MRTPVQVRRAPFEQKASHKFRMSAKNDAYAGLLCITVTTQFPKTYLVRKIRPLTEKITGRYAKLSKFFTCGGETFSKVYAF